MIMLKLPSDLYSVGIKDFLKGAVMAVIVPALLAIQQSLSAGVLTVNWKALGVAAMASFIGYLIKNFFTNSVPAAVETVQKAQEKQISIINNSKN